jgi:hypothetical protein
MGAIGGALSRHLKVLSTKEAGSSLLNHMPLRRRWLTAFPPGKKEGFLVLRLEIVLQSQTVPQAGRRIETLKHLSTNP